MCHWWKVEARSTGYSFQKLHSEVKETRGSSLLGVKVGKGCTFSEVRSRIVESLECLESESKWGIPVKIEKNWIDYWNKKGNVGREYNPVQMEKRPPSVTEGRMGTDKDRLGSVGQGNVTSRSCFFSWKLKSKSSLKNEGSSQGLNNSWEIRK